MLKSSVTLLLPCAFPNYSKEQMDISSIKSRHFASSLLTSNLLLTYSTSPSKDWSQIARGMVINELTTFPDDTCVEAEDAERTGVNNKKLCIARQDKKRIYRPGVNSKKLKNSRETRTIYVDGACDCIRIM
ncbi:unnamed protein product [Mycena citricolor]|uniref:Uncharacterized protein n=1 Tax=Mycena citricolor TaxID=2018698 RepID=A0AAD2HSR3_9AGAR|nr:unnamed protein product [Mycena citricolor]